MSQQRRITDDLDALLNVLPKNIVEAVHKANDYDKLLEIIIDLGRVPTARYVESEVVLSQKGNQRRKRSPTSTNASVSSTRTTAPASSAHCTASPPSATGAGTSWG